MNKGEIVLVILVIIAIIILAPPIISDQIYNKAKKVKCILEVDYPSIGGFPSEEYKCKRNPQLEQQLNLYLKQSEAWFGVSFILIVFFLYGVPIILFSILIFGFYKLLKRLLK